MKRYVLHKGIILPRFGVKQEREVKNLRCRHESCRKPDVCPVVIETGGLSFDLDNFSVLKV